MTTRSLWRAEAKALEDELAQRLQSDDLPLMSNISTDEITAVRRKVGRVGASVNHAQEARATIKLS